MHGRIDGFSRLIVFMDCNDNNRSSTVLQLFLAAVQCYEIPERVRTDRGGENTQASYYSSSSLESRIPQICE